MKKVNLEEVRTVSRLDAVQEQLDVAINLFFGERILASVTLAAAAERVLSDLLKGTGQLTSSAMLAPYFEQVQKKEGEQDDFYKWQKAVYDWLRHADRQPEATQVVSPYEALMWIMSGVSSFHRIKGHRTAAMQQFLQYWENNIANIKNVK